MAITPQQRIDRQKGIGGSDAGAILGHSSYSSALDIYNDKVAETLPEETPTPPQERGNKLEPIILRLASQKMGCDIVVPTEPFWHPSHDFMFANLDGVAGLEVIEAKSVNMYAVRARELGEQLTDQIPADWLLQAAHCNEVMSRMGKIRVRFFVALVKDDSGMEESIQDFREYVYERNEQLGSNLIANESHFWNEHVVKRIPPPVASKRARVIPKEAVKLATPEILAYYQDACAIQKQIKKLEKDLERNKYEIEKYLDEYEYLMDESDNQLATRYIQTINYKAAPAKEATIVTRPVFKLIGSKE